MLEIKTWNLVKKKRGDFTSFIIAIIGVLAMFVLMVIQIDMTTNINRIQTIEQIGREYLLRMESDGYLTISDQTELETDLTSLGYVGNVVITAPMSEVGYGERIVLKVEYDLQMETVTGTDLFQFGRDTVTIRKTFMEATTSKH